MIEDGRTVGKTWPCVCTGCLSSKLTHLRPSKLINTLLHYKNAPWHNNTNGTKLATKRARMETVCPTCILHKGDMHNNETCKAKGQWAQKGISLHYGCTVGATHVVYP